MFEMNERMDHPKTAWPKITIITPVFNQAVFLRACIKSVLKQDYPNLEYIVIDGGSTDGSKDLIQQYASQLSYWVSEGDHGQAHAINKGFKRSSGMLISWLNADDYLLPGALPTVAESFLQDPEASFYFGDGLRVDKHGRTISPFFPATQVHFDRFAMLYGLNTILQPATFINRRYIDGPDLVDGSLEFTFDTDLWLRLSARTQPRAIMDKLAASREYPRTKTAAGGFPRVEEIRRVAERHTGMALTPGALLYYLDQLRRYITDDRHLWPPRVLGQIDRLSLVVSSSLVSVRSHVDGFPAADHAIELPDEPSHLPSKLQEASHPRTRTIGFDLRNVLSGPTGGLTQLMVGIIRELPKSCPDMNVHLFTTIFGRDLFDFAEGFANVHTLPTADFYTHLRDLINVANIDVLIRSYPSDSAFDFPPERQIFILPDLQHEVYPQFFSPQVLRSRRLAFHYAQAKAGAIGTLSKHSLDTIASDPWTRCKDLFILSPALPQEWRSSYVKPNEQELALLPDRPFFFYPANLWPHKNHRMLLDAFRLYCEKAEYPTSLVLTGNPAGWPKLEQMYNDLPVRHLGYISPGLLKEVYRRAMALTFFSLYEGFGIPLLEAFKAGTPVICSHATSLPEVGAEAVLTCDPLDPHAICDLMERIAHDQTLQRRLVTKGKERLKHYTWKQTAEAFRAAVDRIGSRREEQAHWLAWDPDCRPLVSVVTPSYNHGRFIRQAIECVLNQTYPNIEYIVVDGGSSDETLDILQEYDSRITWISEPDAGQGDALNKGFARAKGEIHAYLNADDLWNPNAVELAVGHLRAFPECDLVYGQAAIVDEDGEKRGYYNTAPYSFERLMYDNCICQPAAFWRARIAHLVGPFDTHLYAALDFDYWLRIDRAGGYIHHIPIPMASWRMYPGIKSLKNREAIYHEVFQVCEKHAGYIHFQWFNGLWQHRVWEKTQGWPTLFRHVPYSYAPLARAHYALYQLGKAFQAPSLGQSLRQLVRLARAAVSWLLWQTRIRLGHRLPFAYHGSPVFGLTPSNQLDSISQFYIRGRNASDAAFYLRGIPQTDARLEVFLEDERIAEHSLEDSEPISLSWNLDLAPGEPGRLTLKIWGTRPGMERRWNLFEVRATNLCDL
jgi:glycosyltransferase involved in cell wall biosynthesis